MRIAITILLLLLICGLIHSVDEELIYIESSVDQVSYLVQRDRTDSLEASNLLAKIKRKFTTLRRKLEKELYHELRVRTFLERSESTTIQESFKDDISSTSYSVNKGENIVLCLRSRSIADRLGDKASESTLTDENTLFYIVVHELAHIMSDSVGHTREFGENFKFLLSNAIKWKLYTMVDYRKHPSQYCGTPLQITPIQLGFGRR
mmetsp:Transcript_8657/g.14686  ORF Transcript_8657/g.14686 Transcript_8657/m.14686 type:complete len:206 (+) Transcript_8657:172-789(+)